MSHSVLGPNGAHSGDVSHDEAKAIADALNDSLGIEADGEGSVNYIVVPSASVAAILAYSA